MNTNAIPGPVEGTEEWLSVRKYDPDRERPVVFGASDAGAICGRSPYDTPLDIYLRCREEIQEREFTEEEEDRLRRGRSLQPFILDEYALKTAIEEVVEPGRMFFHPAYKFMAATPDGIAYPSGAKDNAHLVETKSTVTQRYSAQHESDAMFGRDGTDFVPDEVMLQAQQQMAVMDMHHCDVVVFFGVFVMRVYPIPRSDILVRAIVSAESELAERIENQEPPEPNWTHPNTKELIDVIHGFESNKAVTLDKEMLDAWHQAQNIQKQIQKLEEERDELKNQVRWKMEGAEIARFEDSPREVRQLRVNASYYTEQDVLAVREKLGHVKRKGYSMLRERRIRPPVQKRKGPYSYDPKLSE